MIVHVVPESTEVSSCGLQNISRVAVQCIWRRAGDGRTIIYIPYIDCEHSTRLCGARSGSPQLSAFLKMDAGGGPETVLPLGVALSKIVWLYVYGINHDMSM